MTVSEEELLPAKKTEEAVAVGSDTKQFVTMEVDGQLFGIPVLAVQDVLRPQKITPIPLSPKEILGSINLRGRIVTVINMRARLGLAEHGNIEECMQVVVDHKDEQYSLVVDSVGEVLTLPLSDFEHSPPNLSSNWMEVSLGVYRLENRLMVVLDIENLLGFVAEKVDEGEE